MATKEMYEKIKHLTKEEIIDIAKHCCNDIPDIKTGNEDTDFDNSFCEKECPYLDVREEEERPNRWCRQWVIHDLIKIIEKENK